MANCIDAQVSLDNLLKCVEKAKNAWGDFPYKGENIPRGDGLNPGLPIPHHKVIGILMPFIENVIFNDPATIVFWSDGSKTVVKCQDGDTFSKETGLAMAIAKRALDNKGRFNETFKQWIPEYGKSDD